MRRTGRCAGSTTRTLVRTSMSAKVRLLPSHSGHAHPMNTAAVSSRWARSRSSSRKIPGDVPSRCTTRMPNTERPSDHPVTAGSTTRLATIAASTRAIAATHTHRNQLPGRVVTTSNANVASTATPGSTSNASAPARAPHEPYRTGGTSTVSGTASAASLASLMTKLTT